MDWLLILHWKCNRCDWKLAEWQQRKKKVREEAKDRPGTPDSAFILQNQKTIVTVDSICPEKKNICHVDKRRFNLIPNRFLLCLNTWSKYIACYLCGKKRLNETELGKQVHICMWAHSKHSHLCCNFSGSNLSAPCLGFKYEERPGRVRFHLGLAMLGIHMLWQARQQQECKTALSSF